MSSEIVKILMVEDDREDFLATQAITQKITAREHKIDWTADYEEAFEDMVNNRHDVYLVDFQLGMYDGLELLRKAKDSGLTSPTIILTSQEDYALDIKAMETGATDYLVKGRFDANILERSIRYSIDRKTLETALIKLTSLDGLTGLHNRSFFLKDLDSLFKAAKRHDFELSLCLCNLDNYKNVNDLHGHLAADEVLKKFGELINQELRAEDLAGRYGGDEFCIAFPYSNQEQSAVCINRIRKQLEETQFHDAHGGIFHVTGTFGVAEATSEMTDSHELTLAAERSLYIAKEHGRNSVFLSSDS